MSSIVNDASPLSLAIRFLRAKRTFPEPWMYDEYFGTHVDYTPAHFGTTMTFSEDEVDALLQMLMNVEGVSMAEVEKAYKRRFSHG